MPSSISGFTHDFVRSVLTTEPDPNMYYSRKELCDLVINAYTKKGGENIDIDVLAAVKKELRRLKDYGYAQSDTRGEWKISKVDKDYYKNQGNELDFNFSPNTVIGGGRESVYAWRLPLEVQGVLFSMKVGKTIGDPVDRMNRHVQIMQASNLIPGLPILELVIKCDNCAALEKYIHAFLTLKGRHIDSNCGNEWYKTTVEELVSIHEDLLDKM